MDRDELNSILAEHQKWLNTDGKEGRRADLYRADLRRASLIGASLEEASLIGASLIRASLEGASLEEASLKRADLRGADLEGASLRGASLRGADLRGADLDFSAFPLWCGGLSVHIDDRIAIQLLFHLVQNTQFSKNTSERVKKIICTKELIDLANEFHREDVKRIEYKEANAIDLAFGDKEGDV